MTIAILPFDAGLGADVRGVDIRLPLTPFERDAIRNAWLDHLVLRFRAQQMSDEQHLAFTRQFGELEFAPAALIERQYGVKTENEGRSREIPPEIAVISNIIGLPVEESEQLLDHLWAHATHEKFTWRQDWQVGDLVWWDNRCAMHRRDAFDPASRRLMHRTQLKGTRPV
jgi:alpha-ketoglutarate-dependent taurine dioxygenase